jgi:hypothetical protein
MVVVRKLKDILSPQKKVREDREERDVGDDRVNKAMSPEVPMPDDKAEEADDENEKANDQDEEANDENEEANDGDKDDVPVQPENPEEPESVDDLHWGDLPEPAEAKELSDDGNPENPGDETNSSHGDSLEVNDLVTPKKRSVNDDLSSDSDDSAIGQVLMAVPTVLDRSPPKTPQRRVTRASARR